MKARINFELHRFQSQLFVSLYIGKRHHVRSSYMFRLLFFSEKRFGKFPREIRQVRGATQSIMTNDIMTSPHFYTLSQRKGLWDTN